MSHSDSAHGEAPSYDDVNTSVILFVGVISAVVTLLIIFFVQGLTYHWQNQFGAMQARESQAMQADQQVEMQREELAGGEGTISIDAATQKVIAQYSK